MQSELYILLKNKFSQFCQFDNQTWKILQNIFIPEIIAKGELFAVEGEKVARFGFVYSGCLRMFNHTESGNELTKHFLLHGDFFVGAMNYGEKNSVSIQSLNKSEILIADYKRLEELSESERSIQDFKNNLVSKYIQINQNRENNYLKLDALSRYNIFLSAFPNLINQIPHYYIASYLGISSTQLSRIRKKITLG